MTMDEQSILTSKAYKRAKTNLRDKLKNEILKHYPHYLVPGFNLHNESSVDDIDLEINIDQYQDFPYHCDLPRPLLPPAKLSRTVIDEEDPVLQLLNIKSHINDDIKRMKYYYHKHEKEFGIIHKKDVKWIKADNGMTTKVPKYLANIAKFIEMDPDPYFKGAYNWYYTGGTLLRVELNNSNILLFPFMGELVASPIVNMEDLLWKPLLQNSSKCELDGSLFELRHNNMGNACNILGRYKYHCNFYTLSESNSRYSLNEVHQQTSKIPFVSADLNSINPNQYCTLNAERLVTLWDVTKMKCINSNTIALNTTLDDPWGSVRFQSLDPNVVLFVDRCCLHYLDVRVPFDRPGLTLCPKSTLEKCENLSVDIATTHNSCRYIGTYHSFLMCDSRCPQQCVQQKWTHQFKTPPLMGSVIERDNKEFLASSSQMAGETTIILNTWTTIETAHSFNFPFTPPYIMETLNQSQMQGMCLNPYLKNRFDLCNTGSTIIKSETGDIFLFVQNSIGDVYYQCVTHETALDKYSDINCKSFCLLNNWQNALTAQPDTIVPLVISGKSNMQNVYENLTNKKLRLKCKEPEVCDLFEPSWKQPLEKLGTYIDVLAPELLAVWEMCEEVPLPMTAAPHQKVLNWLESSNAKALSFSQEEPDDAPTPVNTQELISVSQELDIICLEDSNVLQELLLPKVRTKPVRKKRK